MRVPALKIPPPRASPPTPPAVPGFPPVPFTPSVPFVPAATLFATCTEVSVSLAPAWLRIPPPEPAARPPWMVNFEIETFPPSTSKTRSRLFPSTIVPAPLPLMVRFRVMSRSPVAAASSPAPAIVSLNVPLGKTIVFLPP